LGGLAIGVLFANCYTILWQGASLVTLGLAVLGCAGLGVFVAAGGLTLIVLRVRRMAVWSARHRRTSLWIGAVVLIAAAIAAYWWETRLTVDTPLRIRATADPQTAVFFVWERGTGGLGCGVSDAHMRGLVVEGKPVFLAEEDLPRIAKRGLFATRGNRPMGYLVKARIHMQPRTLRYPSLPPEYDPYKQCYVAVLDWVFEVMPATEQDLRKLVSVAGG
jgi:hypothetical protein